MFNKMEMVNEELLKEIGEKCNVYVWFRTRDGKMLICSPSYR